MLLTPCKRTKKGASTWLAPLELLGNDCQQVVIEGKDVSLVTPALAREDGMGRL